MKKTILPLVFWFAAVALAVLILAVGSGAALAAGADGPAAQAVQQSTLTYCSAPGVAFDGSVPRVDTITVPDGGTVTGLSVYANVAHPNLVEVELSVLHANAGTMLILDRCTGDANLDGTFADGAGPFDCSARIGGTFAPPDGALAVFAGLPSDGAWSFVAHDVSINGDSGVLNEWCLSLDYVPDEPGEETPAAPVVTGGRWNPGDDRINPHPAAEVALYCGQYGIHAYDQAGQQYFFVSYAAIDGAAPSDLVPVATSADQTTTLYNLSDGRIAVQRIQDRGDHTEYYQFFWDACPPTARLTLVYHESGELLFYEDWSD
ncbi:MAG: hypothetical protein JW910_02155 [Anaerolineae bacterium]|nr:hypothetical protein [Anaerolineae bacterium]